MKTMRDFEQAIREDIETVLTDCPDIHPHDLLDHIVGEGIMTKAVQELGIKEKEAVKVVKDMIKRYI